jgi:hypothetical protein
MSEREPLKPPRNPLWQFRARRVGGPGILGIEGRDVVPFTDRQLELIEKVEREWSRPHRRGPEWKYYKVEWARRFEELDREDYEDYCGAGDSRPSDLGICERIAYEDFDAHPERWPKYAPDENPKNAAHRVWEAVKTVRKWDDEVRKRASKTRAQRGLEA